MADWGLCTTAKAPVAQIESFLDHHLSLGAAHVWLHLDDPDADAPAAHTRVTVTRCDARWWGKNRPEKHQNRQSRNMRRLYNAAPLPWIAHIDVDERIAPARPVAEVLADATGPILRMRPWEALTTPADHYRAPVPPDLAEDAFGPYAPLLPAGALSHAAGKAFFRTGEGLEPRIHGAFRDGVRVQGGAFHPDLPLLHHHADDAPAWRERLRFRLGRGAYQFNPSLAGFLADASDAEIDAFYARTQSPPEDALAALVAGGLVRSFP